MVSVVPYLTGRRFTWRGTMHDGSINRGGRRGREPAELRASQQPPTHLLLDFLPTWPPIPSESTYLNSRALVKPGYYYTPRGTPTAILVIDIATRESLSLSLCLSFSLSLSLGSQAEILWNLRAIGSLSTCTLAGQKARLSPQLLFWSSVSRRYIWSNLLNSENVRDLRKLEPWENHNR